MAAFSTSKPPSNWKPDEADRYVLNVLYETVYLQEPQLRTLYNLSESSVNARLKRLMDAGLVERKKPAADEAPSRVPFVYQIAPKAYDHLARLTGGQFRRHKPIAGQQLNSTTISHPLAVAGLAVALLTAPSGTLPNFDWWGEHRSQMRLPITVQHPQPESLVQPDGVIRLLANSPTDWITGHSAPATSAWWVEVDRGTEDQRKWAEKIARFARAINQRAWEPVLGKIDRPGLLVTVNSEADMVSRALWIAHAAAAQGRPIDWPVWIAEHRAVVEAGGVAAPLWRQVQIHANTNQDNVLWGTWSLEAILTRRETYPVQAALERERQRAEAKRKQVEAERQRREKEQAEREREQREQARRERERQAQLAADQQVTPPAPFALPTPDDNTTRPVSQAGKGVDRRLEAAATAQRYALEMKQQTGMQLRPQTGSPSKRTERIREEKPFYRTTSYDEQERKKRNRRLITSLIALLIWLYIYFTAHPTFVEIADSHAHDYGSLPDHLTDYIFCPQFLLILLPVMGILLWLRLRWEEHYYGILGKL